MAVARKRLLKILVIARTSKFSSAAWPKLTARQMVAGVRKITRDWKYDAVSIGFPGPVLRDRPLAEPHNLGGGWVGFNFNAAFGRPVKVVNDAAMQGLGSYKRGKMLFLGLGTGLGSALIVDGIVEPLELGHLPYKKGTYEDYVGNRALEKKGKKKWRRHVAELVARLTAALEPDEVVLGGGNVKKLKNCRQNATSAITATRFWEDFDCGSRTTQLRWTSSEFQNIQSSGKDNRNDVMGMSVVRHPC